MPALRELLLPTAWRGRGLLRCGCRGLGCAHPCWQGLAWCVWLLCQVCCSTFPAACQHKELRQNQAKMNHSAPKYSCKREKQMRKDLLTLAGSTYTRATGGCVAWFGFCSRAREIPPCGKVGVWKGKATKRLFL